MTPIAASSPSASRTGVRLTPSFSATSSSMSRPPPGSSPLKIEPRIFETSSDRSVLRGGAFLSIFCRIIVVSRRRGVCANRDLPRHSLHPIVAAQQPDGTEGPVRRSAGRFAGGEHLLRQVAARATPGRGDEAFGVVAAQPLLALVRLRLHRHLD